MISNLERYKKDLDALIAKGNELHLAMQRDALPDEFNRISKKLDEKTKNMIKTLPAFSDEYSHGTLKRRC